MEVLYALELDKLKMPGPPSDQEFVARPASEGALDQVVDWRIAYQYETNLTGTSHEERGTLTASLRQQVEAGDVWMLSDHEQLVSMTGLNARLPTMVQLGGGWTPPAHRGNGYARSVIAEHLATLALAGVRKATLFTPVENVSARRADDALGFEVIGDYTIVLLSQ